MNFDQALEFEFDLETWQHQEAEANRLLRETDQLFKAFAVACRGNLPEKEELHAAAAKSQIALDKAEYQLEHASAVLHILSALRRLQRSLDPIPTTLVQHVDEGKRTNLGIVARMEHFGMLLGAGGEFRDRIALRPLGTHAWCAFDSPKGHWHEIDCTKIESLIP